MLQRSSGNQTIRRIAMNRYQPASPGPDSAGHGQPDQALLNEALTPLG
jgi:hypothetical protein